MSWQKHWKWAFCLVSISVSLQLLTPSAAQEPLQENNRASLDWSAANQYARDGDVESLKKFLTDVVRNKHSDSAYVIYRLKDPARDRRFYHIRWEGTIDVLDLYHNKIACLKMRNVAGVIIRRNFENLEILPVKNRKRVEVRDMDFVALNPETECTISGQAMTSEGAPAANAQILVDNDSFARCDDEGKFQVAGLSAGPHSLRFTFSDETSRHEVVQNFELKKGKTELARVSLKCEWKQSDPQ